MRWSLVVPLVAMTVGCEQSPLSPIGNLDGAWEWELDRNPSGSGIDFSLTTAGPVITGTGWICGVGPACAPGSVTITGECLGARFQLTIRGDGGFLATYSGQLKGRNQLTGTWTKASDSGTVVFNRK